MRATCQRVLRTIYWQLRPECLDHILILNEKHVRRLVNEYMQYFNDDRPHQGIDQRIPAGPSASQPVEGEIVARPVLGGLHHAYSLKAA